MTWTISLASISRWMRLMFVFRPRRPGGLPEQDGVDGSGDCGRARESADLSSHRFRDRADGADPVPRVEPTRPARGLRREPAGLSGAQVARHPQDRSQRRARAGAFGSHWFLQARACEVVSAHAIRSLISARKKLVGQRVTLENQIRGLAVVFGIRLPRALTAAFVDQALKASEGVAGLSAAMRGLIAARRP